MSQPTLEDMATEWLPRSMTRLAAMPGLSNDLGAIQIEADPVAFKHAVFPPFSGGGETTGLTIINGKLIAQRATHVDVRWRAYEVERRCRCDGWLITSRTSLLANDAGVVVQWIVRNELDHARTLDLGLRLSGRSRNTGANGYAWAVPSVPTDVFSFTKTDGLEQHVHPTEIEGGIRIENDAGNGHTLKVLSPPPDTWGDDGRFPRWVRNIAAGEEARFSLLCTFAESAEVATALARRWHGRPQEAMRESRARWERIWRDAFTPGNTTFSGSMPVVDSQIDAVNRLYYWGVLTLLVSRRRYAKSLIPTAYITLWPRRGEGTCYLAWDLPYTSGVLARLDPDALRDQLLMLLSAPMLAYQHTNLFDGMHYGWACAPHPQAVFTAAINLIRSAADRSWTTRMVTVRAKGITQADAEKVADAVRRPAGELVREALLGFRDRLLPGTHIINSGNRDAHLECITTYAYGSAAYTAVQAWGLKHGGAFLKPGDVTTEARQLRDAALGLFNAERGHFMCRYEDGRLVPAANLYDVGMVLNALGPDVPADVVTRIAQFVRDELATETWAHCLSPLDADAVSGSRCDHQWAGCFPAWPAQFAAGLIRSGHADAWLEQWLEGISRLTRQGPFAQAYWAEDCHPPEAGAAAKCFDELSQGNHWCISSGVYYAELILDAVCGIGTGDDGRLNTHAGLENWRRQTDVRGIWTSEGVLDQVSSNFKRVG